MECQSFPQSPPLILLFSVTLTLCHLIIVSFTAWLGGSQELLSTHTPVSSITISWRTFQSSWVTSSSDNSVWQWQIQRRVALVTGLFAWKATFPIFHLPMWHWEGRQSKTKSELKLTVTQSAQEYAANLKSSFKSACWGPSIALFLKVLPHKYWYTNHQSYCESINLNMNRSITWSKGFTCILPHAGFIGVTYGLVASCSA